MKDRSDDPLHHERTLLPRLQTQIEVQHYTGDQSTVAKTHATVAETAVTTVVSVNDMSAFLSTLLHTTNAVRFGKW